MLLSSRVTEYVFKWTGASVVVRQSPSLRSGRAGCLTLCWIIMVLFGVGGFYRIIKHLQDTRTLSWPTCEGIILLSSSRAVFIRTIPGAIPDVTYKYWVNGIEFVGRRIGLYEYGLAEDVVDLIIKQYPVGSKVTVYYDPAAPASSCLEPGPDREHILLFHMAVGFLTFSFVGILLLCCFPQWVVGMMSKLVSKQRPQPKDIGFAERLSDLLTLRKSYLTDQEYVQWREEILDELATFPRLHKLVSWSLVICFVGGVLLLLLTRPPANWLSGALVIAIGLMGFCRHLQVYAKKRAFTRVERIRALDELVEKGLVSSEESTVFRERIERLFEYNENQG